MFRPLSSFTSLTFVMGPHMSSLVLSRTGVPRLDFVGSFVNLSYHLRVLSIITRSVYSFYFKPIEKKDVG